MACLSLVARILTLVACVPLLLPMGLCACRAGGPDLAPSHEATEKSGGCSHHHGDPTEHSDSPPADDTHEPGCPASLGVDRVKWGGLGDFPAHALARDVGGTLSPCEVVTPAPQPRSTPRHRDRSPPLYLAQCSLVI